MCTTTTNTVFIAFFSILLINTATSDQMDIHLIYLDILLSFIKNISSPDVYISNAFCCLSFSERIIRDCTSFVYAQQRSSAGSSHSSECAEPPPKKRAAAVTSATSLFGHYSTEPPVRSVTGNGSAVLRQYITDDKTSNAFDIH